MNKEHRPLLVVCMGFEKHGTLYQPFHFDLLDALSSMGGFVVAIYTLFYFVVSSFSQVSITSQLTDIIFPIYKQS